MLYYADKAVEAPQTAPDTPAKPAAAAESKDAELLREVDRLNQPNGQAVEEQGSQDVDWQKYMGVSDEHAKAVADQVRAQEVKDRFLDENSQERPTTSASLTESEQRVAELSDRLNDPTTAEGKAALENDEANSPDWQAKVRESEAEQERQREREAQSQGQGMQRGF